MLRTKKEVDRHVRELLNKIQNDDDRKSRGYNIARFYFNVDEFESARRYLSEFLSLRPKSSDAHKLMGQIYEKLGQKEKAIQCYKTAYSISDTHKDLVPRICGLLVDIDTDPASRSHWVEEGERLFPHHNNVINLRESLMMTSSNQSKEDQEKFYLREIKVNPLSLSLHVKLTKLYIEWGKEQSDKYEDALKYVISIEARCPFPHSLEWYQTIVEVFKAYENWKKLRNDIQFEEVYLSVLDRYVSESLASSCGPALSSLCSTKEAAQRLSWFGSRLLNNMKVLGADSTSARHMLAQYYFHLAVFISIRGKNESILHKNLYIGCLLLHCQFLLEKSMIIVSGSDDKESIKRHWVARSCYRVSQSGHLLNQLARTCSTPKDFIKKIQEVCSHRNTPTHIHNLVFDALSGEAKLSALLHDFGFMKKVLQFVDTKTQLRCDQEVILVSGSDLRELVWLYLQYSRLDQDGNKIMGHFHGFDMFRSIPFSSSMNTVAPETLCHLDLIAFIVAVAYCRQSNSDVCIEDNCTSFPSILAEHLYTPEQGEWWNAASALCLNKGSKHLDRFRSILQTGLESIRHLGHHAQPPIQLTLHLAKYFAKWISDARVEGISSNEIHALEDRAEHYWSRVVNYCSKKAKGILITGKSKSKIFDIRNGQLNEDDMGDIEEEGELFIADRLDRKGKREDAIQILSRLKTPRASFNRAMLYKKQAQSLLGNRMWQSLSLSARKEYISLLTQSRDALYLTLDRLKMPGVDSSDPLNLELSEEMTNIEHCLSSVTLDDYSAPQSDDEVLEVVKNKFLPDLDLTNGNGSGDASFITPPSHYNAMYSTPVSSNRSLHRQEARPSSERLDAQLRHLTDIQQNTIKNIEEHNAALRSQNEALLQTMMTELKERYMEQKTSHIDVVLEQLKNLDKSVKDLQGDMKMMFNEINTLKKMKVASPKPEPLQLHPVGTSVADPHAQIDIGSPALQGVYNNYMSFCGQQAVGSPLATHPAMFNPCQPPFIPPATLQEAYVFPSPMDFSKDRSQAPILPPNSVFQQTQNAALKASRAAGIPVQTQAAAVPPHSFQISLPASAAVSYSTVVPASENGGSKTVFSTQGLLSNVPLPKYSAVSSHQTPKVTCKNVLIPSSIPVTQAIPASPAFASPSTPKSQFDAVKQTSPAVSVRASEITPQKVISPNRSVNDSDRYVDDGHDPCPDFKPIIPLPAQVEVVTGEEDEDVMFEDRVKLYRFRDKEWKERGIGTIKILHNQKEESVRVLMRREQTHKICCNHHITPSIELSTMSDNDRVWIWAAQDFADEKLELEKFCCKFKTSEVAQKFQKAFTDGKSIAKSAQDKKPTKVDTGKPQPVSQTQKPLSELFKPNPGSWTCDVCLVVNVKDLTQCASCQTPCPGAAPVVKPATTKSEKTVTFKFGVTTTESSKLGSGSQGIAPSFSKAEVIVVTPAAVSSSAPSMPTFNSGSTMTFGPSSSVSISPVVPGASPGPSLFKTSGAAPAQPTKDNTDDKSKFAMDGFTFSKPPVTQEAKAETTVTTSTENSSKPSIFSNFSFSSSKSNADSSSGGFSFNFGAPAAATTSAFTAVTSSGGLFSGSSNTGSMLSFGAVASTTDKESIFKTKDEKAFTAKPLFGESKQDSSAAGANTSKDDTVEDYEPQVDFEPVIPMPDLVEVKTGEESEEVLFCARSKLFRFDAATKEWKERGVGDIKILKNIQTNKVRVLMRRDQTMKVCANHFLTPSMVLSPMSVSDKSWLWAANDFADEEVKVEKFAVRFKTSELANEFKTAFETAQKLEVKEEKKVAAEPKPSTESSSKSLSEMFKPAAGSWECSACLVMNKGDVSACVSCSTSKDGSAPSQDSSVFGKSSFSFKPESTTSSFSFGVPSTTSTSNSGSNFAFGAAPATTVSSTTNPPSFSFGLNKTEPADSSTASQPFTFSWKPQDALGAKPITAEAPNKSASSGFTFGSPGKHEFSFSGIKSPRSRDTSMCESENGYAEEEEDNLYFEPVIPLPDKVEVVTGEEDETSLFTHRSKLFRMRDGEFKERGLGDIRILQHNKTGKLRLLMRREQVHKICLNHYLTKEMEFRPKDDKSFYWVATDFSEGEPSKETFAIRFKTPEIAQSFLKSLQEARALLKAGSTPLKTPDPSKVPARVAPKEQPSVPSTPAKSEDVEIVYEKKSTPEQVAKARELHLPDNFFSYETKAPCPGCIGCRDEEVPLTTPKTKESKEYPVLNVAKNLFGAPVTSQSVFGQTGSSAPTFTFGSNATSTQTLTPSSTTLTFGGQATPATKPSIFGGNTPTGTGSIFGGSPAPGSIFGGSPKNIFGGNATGSVFGNTSAAGSVFGGTPSSGGIFGGTGSNTSGSIFGGSPAQTQSKPGSMFAKPTGSSSISFGDIAKQTESTLAAASPTNQSSTAWVSKPVFGANRTPGADESDQPEDDYDPHYEPVIPMPDLVQVTTGEEGWEEVFSHRAKLYRFETKTREWKERGIGDFKIQFEPNMKKYRFLQRREQVHKLSCNHYLTPNIQLEPMSTSEVALCWLAMDFSEKPEGEAVKFSVKFKTKEIAADFKAAFDSCIAKMIADPAPSVTPRKVYSDKPEGDEDPEDVEDEEEDYDEDYDDDDDEDDEDYEHTLIYSGYCELSIESDKNWVEWGSTELKMYYDDEAYGARVIAVTEDGMETVLNHLISIQTTLDSSNELEAAWSTLNEVEEPAKKVNVKATFTEDDTARGFVEAFQEGKGYAYSSGIEETAYNDVPESELYYGQASDNTTETVRSCDPRLSAALNDILKGNQQ